MTIRNYYYKNFVGNVRYMSDVNNEMFYEVMRLNTHNQITDIC